ncbi:rhamnulokinase [Klebsiella pneumoniae]|uniref:FGGY-family carbohydrate kinase n=1 Tax=Klebsiella pneumoniae TaxID=573 RepID=UPI001C647DDA|nr:FGGY-family carbohydrate kinase [Klebsiella pneumoniae]EIV7896225.1 rhamnulokinase [Klebsiella pneumoniae]QYK88150.1 rhamnulokinase [Klebsiella pneumoniae]WGL05398.1 rhamnulokinase [Klebsiella pneumoniae]HBY8046882.1 rhamnulokinase [Klebsiella pneumoniae]
MSIRHCVAVDLGASSGRVMLASYQPGPRALTLREIHRFTNSLQKVDGFDCWDVDSLEGEIRRGLEKVCEQGILIDSIGIDTWGVDYVLLDKQGQRVGLPISYRDDRTQGLLIPDYFSFRLTGNLNWEYTNATTTQLVNINSDSWDETLLNWTGAPLAWFGKPTHPGNVIGHWICPQGNRIPVVAVASHDTASAVIASPLADRHAAYLSSGTWSLMGFESLTPYTCDAALQTNITNEGGAEGRYRVLKNIMGLWLLQRVLKEQNVSDLQGLIARTAALPACRFIIDCNDDRFINPASMSAEIQAACRDAGQPVPESDAELARCIFDSLALLYARVLNELAALRGHPFSQLHIVGGGSQNTLLNQLCADACGIAVVAGPIEASTLGNIGIQLMTLDELANVDEFRQVVRGNAALTTFTPNPDSEIARFVAQFQPQQTKELCA